MPTEQALFFTCPHCDEQFAQVEEIDKDIHTGETYHCSCSCCCGQVVFKPLSIEDYAATANRRTDCRFCKPNPLYIHPYRTTYSQIEKEDLT